TNAGWFANPATPGPVAATAGGCSSTCCLTAAGFILGLADSSPRVFVSQPRNPVGAAELPRVARRLRRAGPTASMHSQDCNGPAYSPGPVATLPGSEARPHPIGRVAPGHNPSCYAPRHSRDSAAAPSHIQGAL